jgi:dihydroflavonol-4-reductase
MSQPRVLVTGATGFIAGHCISELLEHGYAVRGTVRGRARADVTHLTEIARRTGGSLELVEVSLDSDAGWDAAVDGCQYVWHLASPVPAGVPRDENDIVRPAVDGTLRVLRAAADSGTVSRVLMASSIDAIVRGHEDITRVWDESDWSVVPRSAPYPKSKTLAEKAAWDFVAGRGPELVTVNPGLVIGPLLHKEEKTSMEAIRLLLARKMPAVPRISFSIVDVRDVATALRLAMVNPDAAGNRYILGTQPMWMGDIAAVLKATFGPRGYNVPTRRLPYWVMWLNARVDKVIRLAIDYYGVPLLLNTDKAQQKLGWKPRPPEDAIVAAGESLIRYGIVPRRIARSADVHPERLG